MTRKHWTCDGGRCKCRHCDRLGCAIVRGYQFVFAGHLFAFALLIVSLFQ